MIFLHILLASLVGWCAFGLVMWLHYMHRIFPLTTRYQPRWFRCLVALVTMPHAVLLGPVSLVFYSDPPCL